MRIITKCIIGLILGIIPTVWILQKNVHFNRIALQTLIATIEQECNASMSVGSASINMFTGTIHLNQVNLQSNAANQVRLVCKNATMSAFKSKNVSLKNWGIHLDINNLELYITQQPSNNAEDEKSLESLLVTPYQHPLNPHSVTIHTLTINYQDKHNKKTIAHLPGTAVFNKNEHESWNGIFNIENGNISYESKTLLTDLNGPFILHELDYNKNISLEIEQTIQSPFWPNNSCHVKANWSKKSKQLSIHNTQKLLDLNIEFTAEDELAIKGTIPLVIANQFIKNKQMFLPEDYCRLETKQNCLHITFNAANEWLSALNAKLKLNKNEQTLLLDVTNSTSIKVSDKNSFVIDPHRFTMQAIINKNLNASGTYNVYIIHQTTKQTKDIAGSFFFDKNRTLVKTSGKSSYGSYLFELPLKATMPIQKFILSKKGNVLINLKTTQKHTNELCGFVRYSLLNSFFKNRFSRIVFDQRGKVMITIQRRNDHDIFVDFNSSNGVIYLLGNQNFIKQISGSIQLNLKNKDIQIKQAKIDFHKGTISSNHAQLLFNKDYSLAYAHLPLLLDNFFLSIQQDFLGITYGKVLIEKKSPLKKINVDGTIVLKKSFLQENLFSIKPQQKQSPSFIPDDYIIECFLALYHEQPLVAKTSFLQAQAQIDLHAHMLLEKHTPLMPTLSGTIDIEKGSLNFLRNTLLITSGKILFVPNKLNDPIIDLTAKNRIKKYIITLQASGSILNPTIMLESNPELTEEQIIGLLLAGSEQSSLQTDLPAMIMQNLNDLITGNKKTLQKSTSFFQKITAPLKYIQITPNFTDQSGRGGIKGSMQIDVNDRLHARIQKNLSSQEDLAFQVEYLLTDNINVKAVRDQRGDLGAEIEFRIKP